MDIFLSILRLGFAIVFGIAGMAKLIDPTGTKETLKNFGVIPALLPALTVALPITEVAVAFALLPAGTAWWGTWGAFLLLVIFTTVIVQSLLRGEAIDCHCFGQLSKHPVGKGTLIRNFGLTIAAGFLLFQGQGNLGPNVWSIIVPLQVGLGVVWVSILGLLSVAFLEAWAILHLLRQNGRLLLRIERVEKWMEDINPEIARPIPERAQNTGLPIGQSAPSFEVSGFDERKYTLSDLLQQGRNTAFLFVDPKCGPCLGLLSTIQHWKLDTENPTQLVLISRGGSDANKELTRISGIHTIYMQEKHEVAQLFGVKYTPSAVLVRPDGTIASRLAVGAEDIRSLLEKPTADLIEVQLWTQKALTS